MKYVCPVCQSQLKFWSEFVYQKERIININTGIANKIIRKSKEIEGDQCGLSCTKCDFEYSYSLTNNANRYLDQIIEELNDFSKGI